MSVPVVAVPTAMATPSAVTVKACAGALWPVPLWSVVSNSRLTSVPAAFVAAPVNVGGWVSEAMAPATFEAGPQNSPR